MLYCICFFFKTRVSMLTGRRLDTFFSNPTFPNMKASDWELPSDIPLFPQYTKKLGYETSYYGKWHIGYVYANGRPAALGFDYTLYAPSGEPDNYNSTEYCTRSNLPLIKTKEIFF